MAVVFTVDAESFTGQTRVPNEEVAEAARVNSDVLIPFVSDAIRSVDTDAGVIEVDTAFLGLEGRSERA